MIHARTCAHLLQRLSIQCKLKERLKFLRQVFFMEAGHQMHQFSVALFEQLDAGRPVDNLYLLNGHFQDALKPSAPMQVTFLKPAGPVDTLAALDHVAVACRTEWPLEIMLDEEAILNGYNPILRFLLKLKRVTYLLSLRDYWRAAPPARKSPLTLKQQIVEANRRAVAGLVHRMQLFQQEMLHFAGNLEQYLKTRALQQTSGELERQLGELAAEDMDELAELHAGFLKKAGHLCFLDARNKQVLDMLLPILQITLDFRALCRHYLCAPPADDSDEEADPAALDPESLQFVERFNRCSGELTRLREGHRQRMKVLTVLLAKNAKKGVFSLMNEALLRFNFNGYYVQD